MTQPTDHLPSDWAKGAAGTTGTTYYCPDCGTGWSAAHLRDNHQAAAHGELLAVGQVRSTMMMAPKAAPDNNTPNVSTTQIMIAVALVLAGIGLFMSFSQVSLLTGMSVLYTGLALVVGGLILAMVTKLPLWVRIVTWLVAIYSVINIVYVNHELDQKRQQINQILSGQSS